MSYTIAVVGATGAVGQEMLNILAERNFPIKKIHALASSASLGKDVSFGEEHTLKCETLATFDFSGVDIALFSAGGKISSEYAPKAARAGCVVIDNTSFFRMDPQVPLVVPEVNSEALAEFRQKNIIANPNCSTIQMVVALKPLQDIAPIKRVVVSTYQSVSGAGREAMDELFTQTRNVFVNQPLEKEVFPKQIAFNVIPHIDEFLDDGRTKEEWKMEVETQKILNPDISVAATCVRVPVFIAHSLAIHVEFNAPVSEEEARHVWRDHPSLAVVDHRMNEGYVTPKEVAGEDSVYISRIREDKTVPYGLSFWCVADNLRKGAALNSIQIAEELVRNYF